MKKFILIIALSCIVTISFSQNKTKYEIKLKINGVKDTVIYLGHHFGSKQYVVDTAKVDSKGNAVFSKDRKLDRGIYLIVLPSRGNTYFEILVGKDSEKFSIETDTADFLTRKVKGSEENIVFYEYQKKMREMSETITDLNQKFSQAQKNNEDLTDIRKKMQEWTEEREQYMKNLIDKHPNYFFSTVLKSMIDPKIPEAPKNENGEVIDPSFGYHYYKQHYWDNVDFSENGLLRTPIFEGKLNYFMEKVIFPAPDSLMIECNKIIRKAYDDGDTLMFKYTCSRLLTMYDTSKIMGYDAVMVAIAEEWYLSGKAFWADTTLLHKMKERVDKITPTKIGSVAYNLQKMQSFDEKYYSLHNIPAEYFIIIFYEPSCGHCKKEIPKLRQEYLDTLKAMGTKIFAVYTQYDKEEWLKFIEEKEIAIDGWYNVWDGPYPHSRFRDFYDIYSTPTIFILDKDKKIIGKRLGVEQIKGFLLNNTKKLEYENGLKQKK